MNTLVLITTEHLQLMNNFCASTKSPLFCFIKGRYKNVQGTRKCLYDLWCGLSTIIVWYRWPKANPLNNITKFISVVTYTKQERSVYRDKNKIIVKTYCWGAIRMSSLRGKAATQRNALLSLRCSKQQKTARRLKRSEIDGVPELR